MQLGNLASEVLYNRKRNAFPKVREIALRKSRRSEPASAIWRAQEDSNLQPDRYERMK